MLSTKKALFISILLALIIYFFDFSSKSGYFALRKEYYLVSRVIDGDTIELSNGERVRLLGINSPEINEPFGFDAKDYLSKVIEGKNVYLENDLNLRDDYGRLLAFVFIDGKNINVDLVRMGLAHTFELNKLSKYVKDLRDAEYDAMVNQFGIWKESNITCLKLVDLKISGAEKVVLKNECNFSIQLKNWILEDESHNRFKFPSYLFKPNEIIEIYSNNKTAKFSFNKSFQIWNKEGDSLFLRDSEGLLVLFYRY